MKSIALVVFLLASQAHAVGLEVLMELQFISAKGGGLWPSNKLVGEAVDTLPQKTPAEDRLRYLTHRALRTKDDYLSSGWALKKLPPIIKEGVVAVRCPGMVLFVGPAHKVIAAARPRHAKEVMRLLHVELQKPKPLTAIAKRY